MCISVVVCLPRTYGKLGPISTIIEIKKIGNFHIVDIFIEHFYRTQYKEYTFVLINVD